MNAVLRTVPLLCFGAVVAAQAPANLEIAMFSDFNPTNVAGSTGWTHSVSADDPGVYAALRYSAAAGSGAPITLLFAFTAPDPDYAGNQRTLSTLRALYPFINHPANYWRVDDSALAALDVDVDNAPSDQVVIPPQRIVSHFGRLQQRWNELQQQSPPPTFPTAEFGPAQTGTNVVYVRPAVATNAWPSPVANTDERYTWSRDPGAYNSNLNVFDPGIIGMDALKVAAFNYASQADEQGVTNLGQMIQNTYRWRIQIQAVQVTVPPTSNGRWRLNYSQPLSLSRRTLGAQQDPDLWLSIFGGGRICPSILFPSDYIYLAGRSEWFIAPLASASQADLNAFLPNASGGFTQVSRLTSVIGPAGTPVNVRQLWPDQAVFDCPADAVSGTGYVLGLDGSPTKLLHPLSNTGGCGCAVLVCDWNQ